MGFFSSLGKRISSAAHSLGQKYGKVVRRGVKFVADHASAFKKGADVVGNVAGTLATGAAMVGLEPVAGVLGGVAAGAKVAGKIADVAGGAAQKAMKVAGAVDTARKQIERFRK